MLTPERPNYFRPDFRMLWGLLEMILDFPTWMRNTAMVELGTYTGDSTQIFSLFFSPVIAVDPSVCIFPPLKTIDQVEDTLRNNLDWRGVQRVKAYSHDFLTSDLYKSIRPPFITCGYVDANHSYPTAKSDIIELWPLICEDGFMCGHDYGLTDPEAIKANQAGVKQAVDELFGEPDKLYRDTSWVVQKTSARIKAWDEGYAKNVGK